MAEIEALRALHYDIEKTGGLQDVIAPPYDVIDPEQRAELEAKSPYNVVRIDLPVGEDQNLEPLVDPYEEAARQLARWRAEGVIVQDKEPALWVLEQSYTGPDGRGRTRRGFLARVRVEGYGAGRIRPHERTHPGPKEDRLRLTRATRANLSPIFSLYSDPDGGTWAPLEPVTTTPPWGEATDQERTTNRLWRVDDRSAIDAARVAMSRSELLIADGHHRYETARIYADEIGGEGDHRFTLMCLVALEDPGLTVFPTHRLLRGLRLDQYETLADALWTNFDIELLSGFEALAPQADPNAIRMGYLDAHFQRPYMLTLKSQSIADSALPDHGEAYRRLDTAVLEALILKSTLGMSDEDIDQLNGLGYTRDARQAIDLVRRGEYDVAFLMAPLPIERVQEVAAEGESMPPKSTYFFPKVPTGLVFNPLEGSRP